MTTHRDRRKPGQSRPGAHALAAALAGHGHDGRPQIGGLTQVCTDVLVERRRVCGVICYGLQTRDGSGVVLWAHGREDLAVVSVLLAWARARLGPDRPWYAFPGTPATATVEARAAATARAATSSPSAWPTPPTPAPPK
ncbi:hypothetical protein [Kitasatospora sp. KL5]|uniref:hypothetical protein n=1 Tax=Kitasatospora sp. KL5 TaxID=3425125 RepID=UPI003D701697